MQLFGRVLWWSERNENGIIVDPNGNQFYFDRSVLNLKPNQVIKDDAIIKFSINYSIEECLCACDIELVTKSKTKSIEKKYFNESQVRA